MVKPKGHRAMPDNIVTFKVNPRMTDWDIKNYLEKIYHVKVGGVKSRIIAGDLKKIPEGVTKDYDYRIAHVTLPIGETFKWPDLFPKEKFDELVESQEFVEKEINKGRVKDPSVPEAPTWFM